MNQTTEVVVFLFCCLKNKSKNVSKVIITILARLNELFRYEGPMSRTRGRNGPPAQPHKSLNHLSPSYSFKYVDPVPLALAKLSFECEHTVTGIMSSSH